MANAIQSGGSAFGAGGRALAKEPDLDCPCCETTPPGGSCCVDKCPTQPPPEDARTCGLRFSDDPNALAICRDANGVFDPTLPIPPIYRHSYRVSGYTFRDSSFSHSIRTTYSNYREIIPCPPGAPRPCVGITNYLDVDQALTMDQIGEACRLSRCDLLASGCNCALAVCVPVRIFSQRRVQGQTNGIDCAGSMTNETTTFDGTGIVVVQVVGCWDFQRVACGGDQSPIFRPNPPERRIGTGGQLSIIDSSCTNQIDEHEYFGRAMEDRRLYPTSLEGVTPPRSFTDTINPGNLPCLAEITTTLADPPNGLIAGGHKEESLSMSHYWATECDGSIADTQPFCSESNNPCTPPEPPIPPPRVYVIGDPCNGSVGRPPAVLPVENVHGCGTVNIGGGCYTFDIRSTIRATDPLPPGTLVGTQVIVSGVNGSCCECLDGVRPECASRPIIERADWLNGFINSQGNWETYAPTVTGRCCCTPNDRFLLIRADSTYTTTDGYRQTRTITCVPNPPGSLNPCPKFGFNRNAGQIDFGVHLEDNQGFDQTTPAGSANGPVDCEWGELGAFQGSADMTFGRPHAIRQLHASGAFFNLPIPADVPENGNNGSWQIKRYNVIVNCNLLEADAEWENIFSGERVVSTVHWRIIRDTASPCTGGCSSSGGPLPSPGPVNPFDQSSQVFSRVGGCSGCGGGGL